MSYEIFHEKTVCVYFYIVDHKYDLAVPSGQQHTAGEILYQ